MKIKLLIILLLQSNLLFGVVFSLPNMQIATAYINPINNSGLNTLSTRINSLNNKYNSTVIEEIKKRQVLNAALVEKDALIEVLLKEINLITKKIKINEVEK